VQKEDAMWREDVDREVREESVTRADPPSPAPAVVPGSLAWASAVGNQAVARMAAEYEEAPEEAEAPEGEAQEGEAPEAEAPEADEDEPEELPQ
jgi:hypothetical protein